MRDERKGFDKSKIETDDSWNRTLYGSPTIGGFIVVLAVVLYCLFKL
ncbi:hypothetical protein [Fictibacillus barbaricus]|uniref:Uncharacterized protein n=1 Tax=Fictibacillus barbaricus TaxID=182136 RepID=A0ABU1TWH3_9BACL|nr:hypothetical protein [Fictibacillus barbaricus]MDR7071548.1 hypothetical protein [Fictibacillus barbaricus]